ncbi:RNA 2',3'-cyclic phosphodiesterase [Streptomyces sp. AV19]|uniref:RNA 2',3'-cyclic phosphodiesterase n=1 Tax=Streptomyces sp. AV19 TaxID=2793068 RepID=UPI0018FF00A9|nr:RNA 2',3'-cyclic phosphodiesterase [Streptomyces sp. AV19]MBH1936031.1 RNA 2',3'-cyclic phosphodiesterase [Streptomyces sp. AV19]MDG4534177.1 RNA 2',3'-cyclic phosphodiesterase [Streptomyces sp. AV19]
MRLFVAVIPPSSALAELADAAAQLRGFPDAGRLRWAAPDTWHFTLAFLGEVDEGLLPELTERLGRAAHRHPAHEVRLARGGRFGDRVLWAGAEGDVGTLGGLAASAAAGARRTGIGVDESRPFHAHLTLARATGRLSLRPYAEALADFRGTPFRVGRLELVRSRLPGSGTPGERPRYETVESWPLRT